MTKAEFVDRIADKSASKKEAAEAVETVLDGIADRSRAARTSTSPASASSASPSAARARASTRAPASGSRSPAARCRSSRPAPGSSRRSRGAEAAANRATVCRRLAASSTSGAARSASGSTRTRPRSTAGAGRRRRSAAERAADAVAQHCAALIVAAGPACVAVKPQLACFERLGAPGLGGAQRASRAAREAGLLVIADGKRGDVPVSAAAYGQALVGIDADAVGRGRGLGADASTANPLLGGDALEPLIDGGRGAAPGSSSWCGRRTPAPPTSSTCRRPSAPLHERLAELVAERAPRLAGESGLSGLGAVVGATEPEHLAPAARADAELGLPAARASAPRAGGPSRLGAAFGDHPASALVAASRSIAGADDPAAAAERAARGVWAASQAAAR